MWWHRYSERLRHRTLTLKWRLLLLLLLTISVTLLLVGIALTMLITDFHEHAANQRFKSAFAAVAEQLAEREGNLRHSARTFAARDDVVSSLNMLVHYAEPSTYRPVIFDPEKRSLLADMSGAVRAAGIAQMALYRPDGRLVAFFRDAHPSTTEGYRSYRDGVPLIHSRGNGEPWREGRLPETVAADFGPGGEHLSYRHDGRGLTLQLAVPVRRSYPDGSAETLGMVVTKDFLGNGFAAGIKTRLGVDFAVMFDDGTHIGTIDGVAVDRIRGIGSSGVGAGRFPDVQPLVHPDYFLAASAYPLAAGQRVYFVAAVPKAKVKAEISDTRDMVVMVLFVAAFLIVPLGMAGARRTVSEPIERLVRAVDSVRAGEYDRRVPAQRHDELGRLAGAFNEMAETIRQREQALADSESKYRTLVENLPQRIFWKDAELRYRSCNARFAHDAGLTPQAVVGKNDFDLYPPELAEKYRADDRRVLDSARMEEFEEHYVVDGQTLVIQTVKTPLLDAEGNSTGVLGIFWDITARKEAEAKLLQSAAVFENTAEGVMITDAEGTIIAVNRAFTEISGYSESEALGATPALRRSERQNRAFYRDMWHTLKTEGRWQGEIWNRRKSGEVYPEWMTISRVQDKGETLHYVAVFSDISSIKRSEEKLNRLAYHDPLTELPNRALLHDRLKHAIGRARRGGWALAVLFLDLDRFKNVNDTLGHPVGDRLLQEAATRLREFFRRDDDTIARLGGDEFVIMLEEVRSPNEIERIATQLLDAFVEPFHVRDHELYLGASIGISLYPQDGDDVATLVKNADAAMYRAKERGRHNFQFYTHELTAAAAERLELESALRQALPRGELELYYQPQVLLPSGQVSAAEALVRWHHPERGLVGPDKFIPLAEESGLIVPIGEWVLQSACTQAQRWIEAGLPLERISVNLSGVQIQRGDIVQSVEQALHRSGLDATRLELEITESILMQHPEQAIEVLDRLRGLGLYLAVDDFGTGYSSLSYLKRFPITNLKIDKSFVRDIPEDLNDELITRAVIALAHSLQLEVTAEGVETEAQREFLIRQGCGRAQGFFYSAPLPAERFEAFLAARTDRTQSA